MPEPISEGLKSSVQRVENRGMIMIRAEIGNKSVSAAISNSFNVGFPKKRQIVSQSGRELAWMSTDECLGFLPLESVSEGIVNMRQALANDHHLVADVSALRVEFAVMGPVRDILAKGTPSDVSPKNFTLGEFRRSRIGQLSAAFWMTDEVSARILCRRSESAFMHEWLERAAHPDHAVNFFPVPDPMHYSHNGVDD